MAGLRDADRGFQVLLARLRGLSKGAKLTIGVHADDGASPHPSGGTVGEIASIIELGTDKRAPVGFVRSTIDEGRSTIARQLADAGAKVLKSAGGQVEAFGPVAASIARKMAAKVPVDTATVRDAVTARVNGERVA